MFAFTNVFNNKTHEVLKCLEMTEDSPSTGSRGCLLIIYAIRGPRHNLLHSFENVVTWKHSQFARFGEVGECLMLVAGLKI